jgi:predicted HTH transcriptional regulator
LKALKYIKKNEPIRISDLTKALRKYTPYILKKDIKYLVDEGLIMKRGKGRATTYIVSAKEN